MAIIISPDIQDKYFASHILDKFNVVGIFIEPQYREKPLSEKFSMFSRMILKNKLTPIAIASRCSDTLYYKKYLSRVSDLFMESFYEKGKIIDTYSECPVYYTKIRDVSSSENVSLLKELSPDVIAVCGCSILKKNLLSVPPLGTLNLHSGLAPYYRGCSCYFWPLYNNEPEYVGVTIHYVNPGIDDGDIIHQGRPELDEDDNEITIFIKMMKLGTQLMIKSLQEVEDGTVEGHKQTEKGRLYLDSATTVKHFRELHNRLEAGLIRDYLAKLKSGSVPIPKIIG
ncbi:MAG: formyl transferase [Nitrospirota bacterium]|nr:formyl transferase [Nitrospirota bacterium]